ncbi:hypothetical protein V8E54_000030 [Elaphomyces granulatus]
MPECFRGPSLLDVPNLLQDLTAPQGPGPYDINVDDQPLNRLIPEEDIPSNNHLGYLGRIWKFSKASIDDLKEFSTKRTVFEKNCFYSVFFTLAGAKYRFSTWTCSGNCAICSDISSSSQEEWDENASRGFPFKVIIMEGYSSTIRKGYSLHLRPSDYPKLELGRRVRIEFERLQKRFDTEVQAKVTGELLERRIMNTGTTPKGRRQ